MELVLDTDTHGKRGNVILPTEAMWSPTVTMRGADAGKKYSVLMIDADVPVEQMRSRFQVCLWAK